MNGARAANRAPGVAIALLASAATSGCGAARPPARPAARPAAPAPREVPPATTPVETVPGALARDPAAAIRAFVLPFINWSAADVAAHLRGLAAVSVGQARSTMAIAAARAAADGSLHRDRIAETGTAEAIAPRTGHRGEWVLVTRERTTAARSRAYAGLEPTWHVTVVTVRAVPGGWTVSGWSPQS